MTDNEALLYAQSIWGAGPYNAKVKRTGRKFQVGRHMSKCPWVLGEGASWEEAFRAYWIEILEERRKEYTCSPANPRGLLTAAEYQEHIVKIQDALDKGQLPVR
jgi:hypothetical protein